MFVSHRNTRGTDVITLAGRIVMANAEQVRERTRAIADQGREALVVDLGDVEFMDSSGLSVLVSIYERVQARDRRVVLAALKPALRALIELTRLHEIFDIYEDTAAAIEDLCATTAATT